MGYYRILSRFPHAWGLLRWVLLLATGPPSPRSLRRWHGDHAKWSLPLMGEEAEVFIHTFFQERLKASLKHRFPDTSHLAHSRGQRSQAPTGKIHMWVWEASLGRGERHKP